MVVAPVVMTPVFITRFGATRAAVAAVIIAVVLIAVRFSACARPFAASVVPFVGTVVIVLAVVIVIKVIVVLIASAVATWAVFGAPLTWRSSGARATSVGRALTVQSGALIGHILDRAYAAASAIPISRLARSAARSRIISIAAHLTHLL
jgi:hypothetical protein